MEKYAAKRPGETPARDALAGTVLMERKWWTLTAVSAGMFMLLLDITIVNVALPDIQRELGGTLSDLQWTSKRTRSGWLRSS